MTDTTDIPQLDNVDAAIDGLADAPLLEVYRTLLPFDDQMVTAAAVKLALAGGAGAAGYPGGALTIPYAYSARRDAAPASGEFSWYLNPSWNPGQLLAIPSYIDANGIDWTGTIQSLMNLPASPPSGLVFGPPYIGSLRVWRASDPSVFVQFSFPQIEDQSGASFIATSSAIDALIDSENDPFTDGETVYLTITPSGATGQPGGGLTPRYWNNGFVLTQGDPGGGKITLVTPTDLTTATAICASYVDRFGMDVSAILAAFGASTGTPRGWLYAFSEGDLGITGAEYQVTGVTDHTTYAEIAVSYVTGASNFAGLLAPVGLAFTPTGDKGELTDVEKQTLDPDTATPEDIVNALIALGLAEAP